MNKSHLIYVCASILLATSAIGQSPTINDNASRQFGQPTNAPAFNQPVNSASPNLVEGREFYNPFAIAFDTTATPPIMYVADMQNNRVLGFKNPTSMGACGISSASSCGVADLVIGQRDLNGNLQGGPNRPGLNDGFTFPTSIAVDATGALYVLDTGNNRILRFPSPFKQTVTPLATDLVIGQKTNSSGTSPNHGQNTVDGTTLNFSSSGAGLPISLAIEPNTGNLWVSDFGNYRVLRFPVSQLAAHTTFPAADFVLGQPSLNTNSFQDTDQLGILNKSNLYLPKGLTFDSTGNLYVSDSYPSQGRVLFFLRGFAANGQSASRILGVCRAIPPQTAVGCSSANAYGLLGPDGLFSDGTHLFVADTSNHRIVEYDTNDKWPPGPLPGESPQTHQDSPPIMTVIAQANLTSGKANRGQPEPDATTVAAPIGGAFSGTDLWIADTGNNRVVGWPLQGGIYSSATRLIGQLDYPYFQPNLIEGREVFISTNTGFGAVTVDHTSNPPHLYIADTFNNRILGFNDARKITPGKRADIVIGQSDLPGQPGSAFYRALANNPKNDAAIPVPTGLAGPAGVIVDSNGDLWVADSVNGRVLRFPKPFATGNSAQSPNLVLGQADFFSQGLDATQQNMARPVGIAFFLNGSVAVSDLVLHRVLIFKKPSGGDFQSGAKADVVLGQINFSNSLPGNTSAALNSPRHVSVDSSDRLYVADTGNSRLSIFNNPTLALSGAAASLVLNLGTQPLGVAVTSTGESWVTQSNGTMIRLPDYNTLNTQSNPNAPPYNQILSLQSVPLAIGLDNAGNLIVAESINRVTFYFPKLTYQNVANYNGGDANGGYHQALAPGQLAAVFQVGRAFSFTPTSATNGPTESWPTTLGDLQVTINGVFAPIFRIDSNAINFQVPSGTPPVGTADFVVLRASTGETVASGSIPMAQYNPGFFTLNSSGSGQAAAQNVGDDGSLSTNSQTNPISRDGKHMIVFYLTGAGVFDGAGTPPPDGFAPTAAAKTHELPVIGSTKFGGQAPDSSIAYSGAGAFAGGWQINFIVPAATVVGQIDITVSLGGVPSNIGPGNTRPVITFWTK
jgi:uncharacterized protein (TIGR03437 family)